MDCLDFLFCASLSSSIDTVLTNRFRQLLPAHHFPHDPLLKKERIERKKRSILELTINYSSHTIFLNHNDIQYYERAFNNFSCQFLKNVKKLKERQRPQSFKNVPAAINSRKKICWPTYILPTLSWSFFNGKTIASLYVRWSRFLWWCACDTRRKHYHPFFATSQNL